MHACRAAFDVLRLACIQKPEWADHTGKKAASEHSHLIAMES